MAEYIEREELIKHLKNNEDYKRECGYEQNIDIESLISYLEKIPTADVVKVVMCKDCKYCEVVYPYKEIGEEPIKGHYCKLHNSYKKQTDFCSYGELKELGK